MLTCLAIGLCPTLNTYIPSLTRGTPFKISLHSWSKPVLSSPKFVRGHEVVIAIHVTIDGKTVASVIHLIVSTLAVRLTSVLYQCSEDQP
jgi:recombinational DNA repair protein RecR